MGTCADNDEVSLSIVPHMADESHVNHNAILRQGESHARCDVQCNAVRCVYLGDAVAAHGMFCAANRNAAAERLRCNSAVKLQKSAFAPPTFAKHFDDIFLRANLVDAPHRSWVQLRDVVCKSATRNADRVWPANIGRRRKRRKGMVLMWMWILGSL